MPGQACFSRKQWGYTCEGGPSHLSHTMCECPSVSFSYSIVFYQSNRTLSIILHAFCRVRLIIPAAQEPDFSIRPMVAVLRPILHTVYDIIYYVNRVLFWRQMIPTIGKNGGGSTTSATPFSRLTNPIKPSHSNLACCFPAPTGIPSTVRTSEKSQ